MLPCKTLVNIMALVATFVGTSAECDPNTATYSLTVYGMGDWGKTPDSASVASPNYNPVDVHGQKTVATLMNMFAQKHKPNAILAHGDNFYWIGMSSQASTIPRFKLSYEDVYNGEFIKDVPTCGTMGNHDLGGSDFLCTDGESLRPCNTTEQLMVGLHNKFKWQSEYRSPNNNRWHADDRYFVYSIRDPMTNVSIDIFNVDTNDADVNGKHIICCQCYGYAGSDSGGCNTITADNKYCFGGNKVLYDACMKNFDDWGEYSRKQLIADVRKSTATWKIINTHFSFVQHYNEPGYLKWLDTLRDLKVNGWINGHTHGEKHDYFADIGLHLIENGAGGGSKKEAASTIPDRLSSSVENVWRYSATEYGFMSLSASQEWLRLEYVTAASDWEFKPNFSESTIGTAEVKHCWNIPHDGSKGMAC